MAKLRMILVLQEESKNTLDLNPELLRKLVESYQEITNNKI